MKKIIIVPFVLIVSILIFASLFLFYNKNGFFGKKISSEELNKSSSHEKETSPESFCSILTSRKIYTEEQLNEVTEREIKINEEEFNSSVSKNEICANILAVEDANANKPIEGIRNGMNLFEVQAVYLSQYLGEKRANEIIGAQYNLVLKAKEAAELKQKEAIEEDLKLQQKKNDVMGVLSSTVEKAIVCNDDNNKSIRALISKEPICQGGNSDDKWPAIETYGAQWGGCDFMRRDSINNYNDFQYCAKLSSGKIIKCTRKGCYYF